MPSATSHYGLTPIATGGAKLAEPRTSPPMVQFPNLPLIVAFSAGEVAGLAHVAVRADLSAISYLAMSGWAYEELVHGVNWFRHLLGLTYAISTVAHVALALRH